MSSTIKEILTQDEAISILNAWGSKGFFGSKKLGDSIQIQHIEATLCYKIRAKTQYEYRSLQSSSEPYCGGVIDNKGTPPTMRDTTVAKPSDFKQEVTEIIIPHTDSISTCETCSGNCRVSCSSCDGSGQEYCYSCSGGRQLCGSCGGSGHIQATVYETKYDFEGRSYSDMQIVNNSCSSCGGSGQFLCSNCHGSGYLLCGECGHSGQVNCETCQAYGKLKTYNVLKVSFNFEDRFQIIGATEIPSDKISGVTGQEVFNEKSDKIKTLDELSDKRLAQHAFEFLSQCDISGFTILFQKLEIIKIPVYKVEYQRSHSSKQKFLWIYGNENQVYSEDQRIAPAQKKGAFWRRIAITVVAVISTKVAYGFYNSSNTQSENFKRSERSSPSSTTGSCEGLQLTARRSELNIDSREYVYQVDSRFRQKYPDFSGSIDSDNEAHAPYQMAWCEIADKWLTEQKEQLSGSKSEQALLSPPVSEPLSSSTAGSCNGLQLTARRSELNIDSREYVYQVDFRFRQKYPDFSGPIDSDNEAHAPYQMAWCEIADKWLTEQEKQLSEVGSKSKEEISPPPVSEPLSPSATDFCGELQLKARRTELNINSGKYVSQIDSRFRQKYPDFSGLIDFDNETHAPYLIAWCEIADKWLTEQEKQSSQVGSESETDPPNSDPSSSESACSLVLRFKEKGKTGQDELFGNCG